MNLAQGVTPGRVCVLIAILFLPALLSAQPVEGIHPSFPLLDQNGRNVLGSSGPVSSMKTCGQCHDTEFIEQHSPHADAGLRSLVPPGTTPSGRPWDISSGLFGRWNPITYRYLSPISDTAIDLSTVDWIRFYGFRHAGGGPAVTSRSGDPLTKLDVRGEPEAETTAWNPDKNRREPWRWRQSGVVEQNCFLCHLPEPDNDQRLSALQAGEFAWATTATLAKTGVVSRAGVTWQWNAAAFDEQGHVRKDRITVRDPKNANCGLCHGLVQGDPDLPVLLKGCVPNYWTTLATGQIISPQHIAESGLNIQGKVDLIRSWDVHAERLVDCVDCHYARNNPIYPQARDPARPAHLRFEARRLSISEYVQRPSHSLANSSMSRHDITGDGYDPTRGCTACHAPERTHRWLPYAPRHMARLACTVCHVPRLYAPARQVVDWTVVTRDLKPRTACRGVTSSEGAAHIMVEGFEPLLLPRHESMGNVRLTPHNVITTWFWMADEPTRPVRITDLAQAYLQDGVYHEEIVTLFDANGDHEIDADELLVDSEQKAETIRTRLEELGLKNPRIVGEISPYPVHHGVAAGRWATKECAICHQPASRLDRTFLLAGTMPVNGHVTPVRDADVRFVGETLPDGAGRLLYIPQSQELGLYILGHSTRLFTDAIGLVAFCTVLIGITVHGGLRLRSARIPVKCDSRVDEVYMYTAYERIWHWVQALAVLLLVITGLEIHLPAVIRLFGFKPAVSVHNTLGFLVVINALFAAFYHVVSGEIRQYLPHPQSFFDQALQQARYYLVGIFRGEPHPFAKVPVKKLNPLQQITYLGLLNILLPVQVATGVLIWVSGRWPQADRILGGLSTLSPIHAVGAWLFGAFVLVHIYLTTTGPTPLTNIRAMITGWEKVEMDGNIERPTPNIEDRTSK